MGNVAAPPEVPSARQVDIGRSVGRRKRGFHAELVRSVVFFGAAALKSEGWRGHPSVQKGGASTTSNNASLHTFEASGNAKKGRVKGIKGI